MRYHVKKNQAVSRTLAFLFCIALFLGELNVLGMDWNLGQARLLLTQANPKGYAPPRRNDAVAEMPGVVEEEASGETIVDIWGRSLYGILPLKYMEAREFFLFVPLMIWSEPTVLMKAGNTGREYLIRYIHDSDGEKGIREVI